jgi:hypothetical protein
MSAATIASFVILAFLWAPPALARSDCHHDMKDMLEGTLEVAKDFNSGLEERDHPVDCTLATWSAPKMTKQLP